MTPAETPVSTVSVKRRRSSSWRLASISSRCWLSSWLVMRLKARLSEAELVVLPALGDAGGEIAAAHLLGRGDEAADRRRELGREMDADRHRGDQEQQRHHHEDQREGDLEARALPSELLVLRGGALGLARCGSAPAAR